MDKIQALKEAIAKNDPILTPVYQKLLAKLEGEKDITPIKEISEPINASFACSKCGRVCASGTGRSAHERKCKVETKATEL